ncbi:DUF6962 family protein [Crocinitomix catalasitica]|uniref:DUF6962 family protein n=1 Tax=Crocinitomix catalasitica TaxID=184607 RepID=UPI0004874B70|nr:hypothetical protein [Crocinitomix catalasitica]
MIGSDYEKIEFVLFNLNLLEPMGFITDTLLAILSITLGLKLRKLKIYHPFKTYWIAFFYIFGIGAFLGGLGHLFFNYWGVSGKFPSWISGPIAIYTLEQAMISVHPNQSRLGLYKLLSFWKLIIVFTIFTLVCIYLPIYENPTLAFLPSAINTILGVVLTAGILARYYAKTVNNAYMYFVYGVLILLPSAFIFLLKINLHQWFDKNDFSHILMMLGILYFYLGAKKVEPLIK